MNQDTSGKAYNEILTPIKAAIVAESSVISSAVQTAVEAANETAITITETFRGMVTTNTVAVPLKATSSKLKVGGFITNLTGSPTVYMGPSTVTLAADDVNKSVLEAGVPLPLFAGEDLANLYVISASAGHITFRGC